MQRPCGPGKFKPNLTYLIIKLAFRGSVFIKTTLWSLNVENMPRRLHIRLAHLAPLISVSHEDYFLTASFAIGRAVPLTKLLRSSLRSQGLTKRAGIIGLINHMMKGVLAGRPNGRACLSSSSPSSVETASSSVDMKTELQAKPTLKRLTSDQKKDTEIPDST
jgi:hypothetical protein